MAPAGASAAQAAYRSSIVNIKDFGAIGNGDDITSALTSAIASKSGPIYIPGGSYKLSSSIDLTGALPIYGDGYSSLIQGNFPDYLFGMPLNSDSVNNNPNISRLQLYNSNQTGGGILISSTIGARIQDIRISASKGIAVWNNNFSVSLSSCVVGWAANTPGSIGILATGHTHIESCDLSGFDEGIRIGGVCCNVLGCRVEVNNIGLRIGVDGSGAIYGSQRSLIAGNSFEANGTAVYLQAANGCSLTGLGCQGSVNAPGGMSHYGLHIGGMAFCEISSSLFGGTFDGSAILLDSNPTSCSIRSVQGKNGISKSWSLPQDYSGLAISQCNN